MATAKRIAKALIGGSPTPGGKLMGAMASEQLNVVLAISHGGLGEGIRDLLATVFDSVVTVADEGSLRRCAASLSPDLVVLDLDLVPGQGRRLVADLLEGSPELPVLVLTTEEDPVVVRELRASGAAGCLAKGRLAADLIPWVEQQLSRSPSIADEGAEATAPRGARSPHTGPGIPR